jgi:hypothetical protein
MGYFLSQNLALRSEDARLNQLSAFSRPFGNVLMKLTKRLTKNGLGGPKSFAR